MDHREFQAKMARYGFCYRDFRGVGFGPFKLKNRKLFSERASMRISETLTRLFGKTGASLPYRWLADVSFWVYQKDTGRDPGL
jgi:hypothetical protein